jgi:STAS-like domain of unknown function (DUF4325)
MERVALRPECGAMKIRVVEYARSPGGRFRSDGPFSGEWFREEIVRPALTEAIRTGGRLEIELDGTSGYGSSFLEECFGGLIRKGALEPDLVRRSLVVTAKSPIFAPYKALAERYIRDARRREAVAA